MTVCPRTISSPNKMDGSSYVEVTASPEGTTAAVGAVTDVSGDYVTIKTKDSSVELKLDKMTVLSLF